MQLIIVIMLFFCVSGVLAVCEGGKNCVFLVKKQTPATYSYLLHLSTDKIVIPRLIRVRADKAH